MARTMLTVQNGRPTADARKRAAILDRIERRESREMRELLAHIAGTDTATLRREMGR